MKRIFLIVMQLIFLFFLTGIILGETGFPGPANCKVQQNICYKTGSRLTPYEEERCRLDLYIPKGKKNFPALVWFHGGSLHRCSKDDSFTIDLARAFVSDGIAVAVVNYRLSPRVKYPAYVEDAAASVAWVKKNIAEYGGNEQNIYIAGHSAGGYLTLMLGMEKRFLKKHGMDTGDIAGLIPIGAQTLTHYAIRQEMGVPDPMVTPIIDRASPCYHIKKDVPPVLAICGDRDGDDRKAENHLMLALLKKVGHRNARYLEIPDRNHWDLVRKIPTAGDPLRAGVIGFIFSPKH